MTSSTISGGGTATYVYDGNGKRVMKTMGGAATTYVYDALGRLIAEYGSPTAPDSGTKYVSVDHLGSTRLVTDTSPNPNQEICYDYLPFGEQIPNGTDGRSGCYGSTATPLAQKFTGMEREGPEAASIDFFQARYMSSAQQRFTSADPLGNFVANAADPQSWNMYAYARNYPLALVDPTGLECVYAGADNGTLEDFLDPTNYIDDNNGGQSCAQASNPDENNLISATAYGGPNAPEQEVNDAIDEFFGGGSKATIVYGPEDPFTQSFQKSAGMDAITAAIKANCSDTTGKVPVGTAEAFENTLIDGILGGAGFHTPEAQLGAFNATWARGDGRAEITVTNPISMNSLLFHVPEKLGIKNPASGHLGTVNQTLHIVAPDPCHQ